jgi:uncharacterized protein (DUF1501 family)
MSRPTDRQKDLTRRDLFRRAACAAVSSVAIASAVRDLRLINAAAADSLPAGATDYKALVCIFMFGGNDANNFLVPTENTSTGYQAYSAARQNLALPAASLLPITPLVSDGHSYGLHPSCTEIASLFNSGKLAILPNVGTLLFPITRTQYLAKSVPYPPQLFSHNDQVIQWQTSIPDRDSRTGWGGRVADLMDSLNGLSSTGQAVSMSISIAGVNTFEVGNDVNEYNVSTTGPQGLATSNTEVINLNNSLQTINAYSLTPASATVPQTNLYQVGYANTTKHAIDNFAAMNQAIAPTNEASPTNWVWAPGVPANAFPNTGLGRQLKMVARIIAGRKALGHARQIFFVSIGGYDLHDSQYGTTADPDNILVGAHANLLRELSQCINAFQSAITQLRTTSNTSLQMGANESVVGFTASDFGRTFPVNSGKGSDHGWGNHHVVFGDPVAGNKLYGTFPTLAVNGPDDTGIGRWIPKTSVDQYSATLAKWFGVSPTNLNVIFPNLPRFGDYSLTDMGFISPAGAATPSAAPSNTLVVSADENLASATASTTTTSSTSTSSPKYAPAKPPAKPNPVKRPTMRKSS